MSEGTGQTCKTHVAEYVRDMAAELAALAGAARYQTLSYLLAIAELEASNVAERCLRKTSDEQPPR
jgi:hypothetical protein